MSVTKPYYLTVRQLADGSYANNAQSRYVLHGDYATTPTKYIRSFLLIQKDLINLLEYIEPSDANLKTYSLRTYELLLRTCTEVEANFKAIMTANKYTKTGNWNINDYYKVQKSHFLSEYIVRMPYWTGRKSEYKPFSKWKQGQSALLWYQAYNKSKHDSATNLNEATFEHLINAYCGLAVLLSAQYYTYDFGPRDDYLIAEWGPSDYDGGIGEYVRIAFPKNMPKSARYDFHWETLATTSDPFVKFDYDAV